MNERIKQLADEAAKYSAVMALPTGQSGNELFVEKLAELIIKECGVALNPPVQVRNVISRGQAYNLIRQHFGVSE
jgi:hypothetical protein